MHNLIIRFFTFLGVKGFQELKSSNYGRNYGWWVELDGEVIGELINVQHEDMF